MHESEVILKVKSMLYGVTTLGIILQISKRRTCV